MIAPGEKVTPDVTLLYALDSGAMGSIWVAKHEARGIRVAVKFMTAAIREAQPSALDRFKREAAVLRQVDHEHIVKGFGQGTMDDGTPFIVMELLAGENLVSLLERRDAYLSFAEVDALVEQLAGALAHMHQFDIVHRDLKAENVFVVESAPALCIKVIDLGVAKVPDMPGRAALTTPGMLVGSAEYMSPEQIVSAATVGREADLWGMAVCTYVALTADLPFHGNEMVDLFMAIRAGRFTPPSALREGISPAVDAWFARALHARRAERFQFAEEMLAAWREARGGAVRSRKARIDPVMASVVGAVLVLIVVVIAILAL